MEDLVSRAKKGESEAFLKLIDSRIDTLYKIALSFLKNSHDAKDAVQDSILVAHKKISKLRDNNLFNSWIASILVNRCRELLRKSRKLRFEEYSEGTIGINTGSGNEYEGIEESICLLDYLEKLEEKYRETVTLKYFGDYSIKEIAEILNIPEGTVKSRLSYGLNTLRSLMGVK